MTPSKWNGKKVFLLLGTGALLMAFPFVFLKGRKEQNSRGQASSWFSAGTGKQGIGASSGNSSTQRNIQEEVKREARRIADVDENPEVTKERLHQIAESLTREEMTVLAEKSLNLDADGDERFLSVFLVSENRDGDGFPALRRIARSPIDANLKERFRDLEIQVRAQAIEGLGKLRQDTRAEKTLIEVAQKADDAFLRDRAHRSLYEWRTGKPVEEQDQEALEKLLGRN